MCIFLGGKRKFCMVECFLVCVRVCVCVCVCVCLKYREALDSKGMFSFKENDKE